jgi:hypothetical protein
VKQGVFVYLMDMRSLIRFENHPAMKPPVHRLRIIFCSVCAFSVPLLGACADEAVPVGEGAVPVGEGAVPAGEQAVPTDAATVQARLAKRTAAMNDPNLAHLFAGKPQSIRISEAEARLPKAIQEPFDLSESDLAERSAQNSAWAQGVLASVSSRPADLFTRDWWRKHGGTDWTTDGYFITGSPESWWKSTSWDKISRALAMPQNSKPFTYVYDKNLVFRNDIIFVNGDPISSYEDFVESARIMAKSTEWKRSQGTLWTPLGTFALSTCLKTKSAPHAIQLVMDNLGNINGVYANWVTGSVQPIQGKVHRDTQRVAFQLGRDGKIVVEAGLANLTADVLRVWAHLPNQHSQTWLLVRMK